MKGYKGKIYFVKCLEYGSVCIFNQETADYIMGKGGHVVIASAEVDVKFNDSRQQEIEAIEKQIEKERAESQHRINVMLGKIQELQALEHDHDRT